MIYIFGNELNIYTGYVKESERKLLDFIDVFLQRHLDILSSRKYPLPSGNHFSCLVSATGEFQSDTSNFPQASWSQKGR